MDRRPLLGLYALAHFWVDLSCAFLVFRALAGRGDLALCLLLYNFCAFALQMPLGLVADWLDRNGVVAALGCLVTAFSCFLPASPLLAVTAGVGNALFHLGGGIDTLRVSEKKAAALGIFVSPGALGLFVGTAWGKAASPGLWIAPALLALFAAAILLLCRKTFGSLCSGNPPVDTAGDWRRLLPLFLVVVLRSWMGMNQSFSWKSAWPLALTLALVLGKTAGGFAMDHLGPRRASALSLAAAALLYLFCDRPLPGIGAVFLFNMTMPVTLWAAARALPGAKGFSFGLLTFALFLGYLPSFLGWPNPLAAPWSYGLVALVSLLLLWWPLGKEAAEC